MNEQNKQLAVIEIRGYLETKFETTPGNGLNWKFLQWKQLI